MIFNEQAFLEKLTRTLKADLESFKSNLIHDMNNYQVEFKKGCVALENNIVDLRRQVKTEIDRPYNHRRKLTRKGLINFSFEAMEKILRETYDFPDDLTIVSITEHDNETIKIIYESANNPEKPEGGYIMSEPVITMT